MNMETEAEGQTSEYIPKWKVPISKSFSSFGVGDSSSNTNSPSESPERQSSSPNDNEDSVDKSPSSPLSKRSTADGKSMEEDDNQLIQILLPCIVCNRTFSPEALERHNKVCTKVNVKSPYKQDRGQFKSEEQRKKGTRVEYFIPPPNFDSEDPQPACLSRGSRTRSSLRGTRCTTRSTINAEALHLHQQQQQNLHGPTGIPSVWRRQRSISGTRGDPHNSHSRATSKAPSEYTNNFYDDHSEFGSNSEESHTLPDTSHLPSYAKPLAPTDECPFCNRCFGPKAYDRHVQYCKEKYVKRQYEVQPTPKEKIEALERQEIRTKYRPMKSSSSCSSLRSVSPGKDFASMAFKLFGGIRRTDGSNNLYNNQLINFKKSNESLANSCYGDFTRGMRRPSPSPARGGGIIDSRKNSSSSSSGNTNSVTNKINNLLSKTFHFKQNSSNNNNPMRVNTSSNIPLAKSTDNLGGLGGLGGTYTHVSSSGYGQQSNYNNNNNFSRNSRSRSSLHKNFFRSKRVEPEGTENTSSYPLIITPMNFYTKSGKNAGVPEEVYRPKGSSSLLQDPSSPQSPSSSSYDPYEVAAKQLEELLKAQPVHKNVNKKTARKLGLEKAFESVGVHSAGGFLDGEASPGENKSSRGNRGKSHDENNLGRKSNESPFVFEMGSGKLDDSYWDEILQKSQSGGGGGSTLGGGNGGGQGRNQMVRGSQLGSSSGDTKSQISDSGSVSDHNGKSRAMSHISSADSGFSRSDANDSEFEVLESMVGVGEVPQPRQTQQKGHGGLLSSSHASLARMLQKPQQQLRRPSYSSEAPGGDGGERRESPMQVSPTPATPSDDGGGSGGDPWNRRISVPAGSKFCHQCGSLYPTGIAKFCSECGEKRLFK